MPKRKRCSEGLNKCKKNVDNSLHALGSGFSVYVIVSLIYFDNYIFYIKSKVQCTKLKNNRNSSFKCVTLTSQMLPVFHKISSEIHLVGLCKISLWKKTAQMKNLPVGTTVIFPQFLSPFPVRTSPFCKAIAGFVIQLFRSRLLQYSGQLCIKHSIL